MNTDSDLSKIHVPHSIWFGDKNTWDDWHIVAEARPSFPPPTQKTEYITIPGSDGSLDISEALTRFPTFNDREKEFTFLVVNGFGNWVDRYSNIMRHVHGKRLRIQLEDDPYYYYEGRCQVSKWEDDHPRSKISISCVVEPYKWGLNPSTGWLWDPFVFARDTAYKTPFNRITVDSEEYVTMDFGGEENFGDSPVCPEFRVHTTDNKGIYVKYDNESLGIHQELHFPNGNTKNPAVVFFRNNPYSFQVKGHGTFSMYFRIGRL